MCFNFSYQPNVFAQDSPQWNLPEGATTRLGKGWLYEIQYSPDGTKLAAAGSLGVWIYDTATDEEITLLTGYGWGVSALTYSPDGSILAGGSTNGTIRLYNSETGDILHTLDMHIGEVSVALFSVQMDHYSQVVVETGLFVYGILKRVNFCIHIEGISMVSTALLSVLMAVPSLAVVETILSEYGMLHQEKRCKH